MYNEKLSDEWSSWVEGLNPNGTREREIFPFIKNWLDELTPSHLIDIGCGQGSCSQLVGTNIKYIGIDSSSTLLKRATELFSSPNKKFIKGDAYVLPLTNGKADAVMSIWVWSHIENLNKAAKEMHRVLSSNGNFLIITANPDSYEERKTFYKDSTMKDSSSKS